MSLPRLTQARAPLTHDVDTVNEHGEHVQTSIPAERDLTVYVDRRELVTLMTLGARPEWLVLGYLRNQRLVHAAHEIESITVDWETGAAAVKTHAGIDRIEERTSRRVVTTGCGQGSVFGGLMDEIDAIDLGEGAITQADLYGIVNTIRLQESTYKSAGSVHGCALFRGQEMLLFMEDVGRHNAMDTIAGWMWLEEDMAPTLVAARTALPPKGAEPALGRPGGVSAPTLVATHTALPSERAEPALGRPGGVLASALPATSAPLVFYTTGRLTSEMVIKSAQMGVAIVVSRSGMTRMGHEIAQRLGLCAIGRATGRHFLCYTTPRRLLLQPGLATAAPRTAGRPVA